MAVGLGLMPQFNTEVKNAKLWWKTLIELDSKYNNVNIMFIIADVLSLVLLRYLLSPRTTEDRISRRIFCTVSCSLIIAILSLKFGSSIYLLVNGSEIKFF